MQYSLTKNQWSATPSNWEKINLEKELSQLQKEVTNIEQNAIFGESINLFDKNQQFRNGYITQNGEFTPLGTGDYLATYNIPVKSDVWYTIARRPSTYYNSLLMGARDGDNNIPISFTSYRGTAAPTSAVAFNYADNTNPLTFKVEANEPYVTFTVKFTSSNNAINTILLMEGTADVIPPSYIEYKPLVKDDSLSEKVNNAIGMIDKVTGVSLVEKTAEVSVTNNKYMPTNGTPAALESYMYYSLPVNSGERYTVFTTAGGNILPWLIGNENGIVSYSSNTTPTVVEITGTFTIPDTGTVLYVNSRSIYTDLKPRVWKNKDGVPANNVFIGGYPVTDYIDTSAQKTNLLYYNNVAGEKSYIRSPFTSQFDFKLYFKASRPSSSTNNPNFNFEDLYRVNKVGEEVRLHAAGDDITPASYNNTYIGGNHADSDVRKITVTAHGKTYADIGSIWSNGTRNFTLLSIVDENTLLVIGPNQYSYPRFYFYTDVANGDILTHISGATHTNSMSVTGVAGAQFYSSLIVKELHIYADGEEITESGFYYFRHLDICEIYDVLNVAAVVDLIKAGVGTFTENPNPNSFTNADKVARHSIVYGFDSAGEWRIATDFIAFQEINLSYFGFTQQGVLDGANTRLYIPKALPIGDKDFRLVPEFNSLSSSINLTSEYWENPQLPPDRWIEMTDNIALHSGYLFDYGVGGTARKDFIKNAFFLYTSRKIYPHGIDNQITVNGNEVFSAVVWRSYLNRQEVNIGGVIAKNIFEYDGKLYIYADFKAVGVYELDIPDKFIGKEISIFEKSDNVNLLAGVANKKAVVSVTTASPMYGYLVAQIK